MGADPRSRTRSSTSRSSCGSSARSGRASTRGSREAAATLGAAPCARLREITLPLLAPALAAAAAIVFLFSFTSFGIVLILGGPRYATIEAEIYNQAVRLFDLRAAAVLSLVQLACVVAAVLGRDAARARDSSAPGRFGPERETPAPAAHDARQARRRARASAGSRSSSGCRSPCSSSARSRRRRVRARRLPRARRDRPPCCSSRPGTRS